MDKANGLLVVGLLSGIGIFSLSQPVQATTFTVLHAFGAQSPDGSTPRSALVQAADGNFYGVTDYSWPWGGASDAGTAYRMTPSGGVAVIYQFCNVSDCPVGGTPSAGLMQGADGKLYGGTFDYSSASDPNVLGDIFSLTYGGAAAVVHPFNFYTESWNPSVPMMLASDGNYYGVNAGDIIIGGGIESGTIFQMTPAGVVTVLHRFPDIDSQYRNTDGATPLTTLVEGPDGYLYGSCDYGGSAGYGTLYKISKSGTFVLLHTFKSSDGSLPQGPMAFGDDGNFYGTTARGGATDNGTFFRLSPSGTFTSLYSFAVSGRSTKKDPKWPVGITKGPNGLFYGASTFGGQNNSSAAFSITSTGAMTILHSFARVASSGTNADGYQPYAPPILGSDGNLYGTTSSAGAYGVGTIYKITP